MRRRVSMDGRRDPGNGTGDGWSDSEGARRKMRPSRTRQESPIPEISDLRKSQENERGPKAKMARSRTSREGDQSHPGRKGKEEKTALG
jgi:hypothetical protein